ncbi:hypothetical protein HDU81_000472 [Chytriomyces hyalinus]|nr:hypothetical protein HDU81_000472 [Chytriomyces hyalinus]
MFCCFSSATSPKQPPTNQIHLQLDERDLESKTNSPYDPPSDIKVDIKSLPSAKQMSTEELDNTLRQLQGTISHERTELFTFNVPKDFESPHVDQIAREVYKRSIIANGGQFSKDGKRLVRMPTKKKNWEPVIRYIGTLVDPAKTLSQADILHIIVYFLPSSPLQTVSKGQQTAAPTVVVTNMVAMGILEREMGGVGLWRTKNRGHPMLLGKGILPNF